MAKRKLLMVSDSDESLTNMLIEIGERWGQLSPINKSAIVRELADRELARLVEKDVAPKPRKAKA